MVTKKRRVLWAIAVLSLLLSLFGTIAYATQSAPSDGSAAYASTTSQEKPGPSPKKCQDLTPGESPELEAQTTETQEWQCIVWWTKECVEYDIRDCDSCYIPCVVGCAPVCAVITNVEWRAR